MDLDVRFKTIKLLGKKLGSWTRQQVLGLYPKSTVLKGKSWYTGLHQNEKLLLCKKFKIGKLLRGIICKPCMWAV